jgi:hypothetical protein
MALQFDTTIGFTAERKVIDEQKNAPELPVGRFLKS